MLDLDDFMPKIAGFDIKQTREIITQTIIDRSISSESRYEVGGTQFRYSLQVNAAFGYAEAYSKTHQAAELSKFFQRKKGRLDTFLHTDPVSGRAKQHDFAACDGVATSFQLLDLDDLPANYIQSCDIYIDTAETVLAVSASDNAFKAADTPAGGINGVYPSFLPQSSNPSHFNVSAGESIKIVASGSAVVEWVTGQPSGPGGKSHGARYYDASYSIASDCAFKPGVNYYGAVVGVFANASNLALSVVLIGSGGEFTVPTGATKLYVGVNCYSFASNTGGFSVSLLRKTPSIVTPSSYSINRFYGAVTFNSPPLNGSVLSWSGVCAKEVRFDSGMDLSRVISEIFEGSSEIKLITPPGA